MGEGDFLTPHHGRTMARAALEPSLESLSLGVAGLRPQDCDVASRAALDATAAALEECGAATLPVAAHVQQAHACGFKAASAGFAVLTGAGAEHPATLPPGTDSVHASGMHRVGALSNYNACREGFIFSNGATLGLDEEADGFDAAMRAFFASALCVARAVLSALERRLEAPAGWFEATYGPLEAHAQWHVKRFVPQEASPHAVTADGKLVLLPVRGSTLKLPTWRRHSSQAWLPGAGHPRAGYPRSWPRLTRGEPQSRSGPNGRPRHGLEALRP